MTTVSNHIEVGKKHSAIASFFNRRLGKDHFLVLDILHKTKRQCYNVNQGKYTE